MKKGEDRRKIRLGSPLLLKQASPILGCRSEGLFSEMSSANQLLKRTLPMVSRPDGSGWSNQPMICGDEGA
jgi:hypothetical protein